MSEQEQEPQEEQEDDGEESIQVLLENYGLILYPVPKRRESPAPLTIAKMEVVQADFRVIPQPDPEHPVYKYGWDMHTDQWWLRRNEA